MKRVFSASRTRIVLAMTALFSAEAFAAPEAVGRFKDWTVFRDNAGGEAICYAATEATDKAPRTANHGDVWFYVTNWRSGRRGGGQPSLKVGYDLRRDLPPSAKVGRASWTLFSAGDEAFAYDEDDAGLVNALKRGSELRIEAVSARDTQVAYHFSLSGSSAAIDKAAEICR